MNRTTSTQPKPATTQEPRDIEAELAQLRRQHDLILHAIGDGIHGVDADGKILFENPAAARLLGRAPGELLGQPAHHAKPGGAECPIDATFRDGRARRVCGDVFRRKDGTGFPVDYAVTPMENERGKMTGALVVFRDVTEAKELEAQSRRARRIESIGKLAGGVAQDIGDALSPILEVVALFKRKMRDPDDLELLEIVETGARRGTEMVRQMRSFTDGIDGQRVIIHPSQLLRGIAKEADETSPGSIVVSAATPAELPTLLGDPAELHQALHILCANARNAMPEGQKLKIGRAHV